MLKNIIICQCCNVRTLDGVHLDSTLNGMASISVNKRQMIIGMDGLYQVTIVLNWTEYNRGGGSRYFSIYLNNIQQTKQFSGATAGFGTIDRIFNLNKGDNLQFFFDGSDKYVTNRVFNSFTLRKL